MLIDKVLRSFKWDCVYTWEMKKSATNNIMIVAMLKTNKT